MDVFPSLGVSCAFIVAWKDSQVASGRFTSSATTCDVCEAVVKPDTLGKNCSFAEAVQKTAEHGSIGQATHFVSHAWKYNFCDLVAAIEIYFLSLPSQESKDNVFFWVDLFVVDQHNAPARPHSWWSTTFVDAIRTFGKVVLVFQPFLDPIPLTRAWCLWEIFAAIQSGATIDLAMPTEQWTTYRVSLREDYRAVIDNLQALDARKAEAFNPNDRAEIFHAIEQGVGFDGLNDHVRQLVAGILLVGVTRHSCQDNNLQRLTDMLDLSPNINTVSTFLTPLGVASDMNSPLVVDFLLARGADVNATMSWGHSALHVACRAGNTDIVRLLLLAGASTTLCNAAGRTALEEAKYMASNPSSGAASTTTPPTDSTGVQRAAAEETQCPEALLQAMEAAQNALNSLTKSNISELKSLSKPPENCVLVMKCVLLILGIPGPSDTTSLKEWWEVGKRKLLSNPNILEALNVGCDFPAIVVSPATTRAAIPQVLDLLADPALDPPLIRNISQAIWSFCLWARCYLIAHQLRAQQTDMTAIKTSVEGDLKEAKALQAEHIEMCLKCAEIVRLHVKTTTADDLASSVEPSLIGFNPQGSSLIPPLGSVTSAKRALDAALQPVEPSAPHPHNAAAADHTASH
ncbi:hypothetical protein DYB34_005651 [Aphanomyces astaci]|uniref:Dynein heavy chain coiled coil stalk domain-containing protein n=1 Tax=Aphanomyces astaci TaxID=112090 RepID=A0A3R7DPE6_APHAT|nr:hypothetical protein DYB34_005651 [Aphanomyces astaci]